MAAKATYAKARVELERATGQILNDNNISMDEAFSGVVSRPPSAIPAVAQPPVRSLASIYAVREVSGVPIWTEF